MLIFHKLKRADDLRGNFKYNYFTENLLCTYLIFSMLDKMNWYDLWEVENKKWVTLVEWVD